jgi:hypothetical protein
LLFRGPGHFAVYIAYKFPRRGQVLGSGRRWNDPFIEVFCSLLIYLCLAPFALISWLVLTADTTATHVQYQTIYQQHRSR